LVLVEFAGHLSGMSAVMLFRARQKPKLVIDKIIADRALIAFMLVDDRH
jgi:hypothetical protein